MFAKLHADPGRIDVLINCVGQSDRGTIAALRPERLRELFDTNVTASLLCAQAALPLLKASRGTVTSRLDSGNGR